MMPARWIGLILLGLLALGAAPPGAPSTAPSDREARLQERRAARLKEEAEALFRTADTTFLVGDLARALELFERCAALAPNSPLVVRAHARMGDCAYELKRYDDAGKHYRRASSLAEKAAIADEVAAGVRSDYMIGQTHLVARQYAQAFSAFRRFIDRHPGHPLVNKAYQSIGDGHMAMEQYQQALAGAKTVFWNGPMGVFEMPKFAEGTFAIAKTLAGLSGATTVIGGGDSVSAVKKAGVAEKMSHISTGGGASLELVEGKTLPGVAALMNK